MARMEGRRADGAGGFAAPEYFEIADDDDEDDWEPDDDPAAAAAAAARAAADDPERQAAAAAADEERARSLQRAQADEWARWANSEDTTLMWQLVSGGRKDELAAWLDQAPAAVHMRAEDGRGPLWWAYEYERADLVKVLIDGGADPAATDSLGMTPSEMQAA